MCAMRPTDSSLAVQRHDVLQSLCVSRNVVLRHTQCIPISYGLSRIKYCGYTREAQKESREKVDPLISAKYELHTYRNRVNSIHKTYSRIFQYSSFVVKYNFLTLNLINQRGRPLTRRHT